VSIGGVIAFTGGVVGVLVLLIASSFGTLRVEQTEAIGNRRLLGLLFGSHRWQNKRRRSALRQYNITLVVEEPDLAALILYPRHHASAGECGVADRVGVEVGVRSMKLDINDDKMGDVLHVVTKALLRQAFRGSITDQDVASDTTGNLVVDVVVDAELMLCPADFNLEEHISKVARITPRSTCNPPACPVDRCRCVCSKQGTLQHQC